jgi:hypothetical protein
VLRVWHIRLMVLHGLHCVMVQLRLVLQLRMRLLVLIMMMNVGRNSRVWYGGYCRSLRRSSGVVSASAARGRIPGRCACVARRCRTTGPLQESMDIHVDGWCWLECQ